MRLTRNLVLLFAPYLLMILINEAYRPTIKEKPFVAHGITTINSDIRTPEKCSWVGHNDTVYCKEHHVKYITNYLSTTDKIYFGIIGVLHSTGNYGAANVILFVIFIPLFLWFCLVKIIDYSLKIRSLNKLHRNGKP